MGQKEKQDKLLSQRYYSERKNKKLFHLPGQSKEKGKKKKKERNKPQASPGFLHIQGAGAEGGDNGSQHTGDFKRHCLDDPLLNFSASRSSSRIPGTSIQSSKP